jgi:protein-tyrosine kinase
MERIKLAIDRARQQAATLPSPLAATGGPRAEASNAAPGPLQSEPAAPVKIHPLDPAHLERYRIVTLDQGNPYRREFDLLRTQVLQKMQEHGWRTIAVTSPSMQCGKTVVAINLALSIAHHPARSALLVDFDLRRPQVATCLGLPEGASLDDVLAGEEELRDAILPAGLPRFAVLPTHRKVPGAAEIMGSEKVARIIKSLRDAHPDRTIVLDLPPVTAVDDVIAVLPVVDCVLLVVGSGDSSRRELEETQRHLARSNLLGLVVNKAVEDVPRNDYY